MEVGPVPPDPGETPTERRRRLANERRRRYREAHRDQLRDLSRLRREADDADDERQRSQRRREEGTHERDPQQRRNRQDDRDQQQRSQQRREEGTHERDPQQRRHRQDDRDQQQRSQQRREEGNHERDPQQRRHRQDDRDQQQRSQQRREEGNHERDPQQRRHRQDDRDQQQRSQQRREEGNHERDPQQRRHRQDDRDQQQRSQRRRIEGTHERDQQQRSQRRRDEGTHEPDQRQRSQRRRDEGTHADTHLRNRLRSFSTPVQHRQQMHPFVAAVSELKPFKTCNICNEIDILACTKLNAAGTCTRCHRERSVTHKFSAANGMLPDAVPEELSSLSFLEEMLISKVLPNIYVCRLRGGGQYGYSNHAIAFPQELESLAVELPRRPSETGVLLIRKRGSNNTQRDYRVRQARVAAALRWLQANNPYYTDITISQNNIAELPEDGVPDTLPELDDDGDDTDRPEEAAGGGGDLTGDADREEATTVTAVDQRRRQPTEVERIAQAVGGNAEPPLQWPQRGHEPVNEYGHIGLFTQAFPTLFPKASADISHVDPNMPQGEKRRVRGMASPSNVSGGRPLRSSPEVPLLRMESPPAKTRGPDWPRVHEEGRGGQSHLG